jgi:hypothetical protein
VRDVHLAALAGRQFNRVSRSQLRELGLSESMINRFADLPARRPPECRGD